MKNSSSKIVMYAILCLIGCFILTSCSGITYIWGEGDNSARMGNPCGDAIACLMFLPILLLQCMGADTPLEHCNFIFAFCANMWTIFIAYLAGYIYGSLDDSTGPHSFFIEINNKLHYITDYSKSEIIEGTGSSERGTRYATNLVTFLYSLVMFTFVYNGIVGWFDHVNLFFKVIIGAIALIPTGIVWHFLKPHVQTLFIISAFICAFDFVIGVLITLWIY